MELYFLRHGIATERVDSIDQDDSLRPLTLEGQQKMSRAAQGMQTLGLTFDAIISSPYLRAKQTAEIVAQVYKLKNKSIHFTDNLLPPASIKEILDEIKNHFPQSEKILLVGHEPHLTQMISSLLKSAKPLNIDLKKGALCCLSIDGTSHQAPATLHWLMTSKQLGLIPAS